jgi:diguanylate cyclase (GGDEF)-like protein/PAS domain S-box-containing protein
VNLDQTALSEGADGARPRLIAAVAGGSVAGLAAVVLIGWVVRVPWMVQVIPGAVAMVFSNALCMFLLGISLVLTTVRPRWGRSVQTAIGVGVMLTGVTVMAQYRFGIALPLDLPGVHAWLNDNPGRMAPNTALAHALSGLTVLLAVHARRRALAVLAFIGAFAVAMIGVTGLVGYRMHPELLYGWNIETRMALHTATAFLLIGIGYMAAVYRMQQLGRLFRQHEDLRMELLVGALMVFVGLVGGLSAFTLLQEQTESLLRNGLRLSFKSGQDLLVSETATLVQATRNFANRPGIQSNLTRLRGNPGDPVARRALELALDNHVGTVPVGGRLFDARGRLVASAGPVLDAGLVLPLRHVGEAALFWDGQSAGLRTVQPILVQGVRVGRVELTYALPAVAQMLSDASEIGNSGEMQLCAMNGKAIRCLPLRLAPQRSELPSATDHGPTLIARALASGHGVALDTDHRGERVIGVYGPVGDLGLGMVLKVDVAEIYAPVRRRLELTLLVIVLIVGAGLLMLRARLLPLVRRLLLSEKRFRGLLESAPDAMLVTDLDGRILWVNSCTERLFGYPQAELIGQPVEILVPEGAREIKELKLAKYAQAPRHRGIGSPLELYGRRKDGSEFPAEIGLSPQETEDGIRVVSTVRDISERKRSIQALRDSEQRWQFALEGSGDGVWDWNLVTNEVLFSRQWKQMLGYAEHEIGNTLAEWDKRVHPDDKARTYADIDRHLKGETPYYQNEHRVLCKDGTYKWVLDRGMVVARDADGKPVRMIGTHSDISERKRAEETIRELSLTDELTGLRNRRGFFALAEHQLSMAHRLGRQAVLYYADLDGLKRINDEFGHAEGDRAIADVAAILRETFRESDIIARLGGDEFVVLALDSSASDPTSSLARLEQKLAQHNRDAGRPCRLAISVGVALSTPESGEPLSRFLVRADADMYRVKQQRHAVR